MPVRLMIVFLAALLATASRASAAPILDYSYTGVVTDVYDPFNLFAGVSPGTPVSGQFQFSAPVPPPVFSPSANFTFSVGGGNQMTATVGGYSLQARQQLFARVYNPGRPFAGNEFQFADSDPSPLSTADLPLGYELSDAGALVELLTRDLSTNTFPNLPSELLPLARYNRAAGGFFFVDVFDAQGDYVDSAFIDFRLTSLQRVPEPASVAVFAGLLAAGGWAARRRKAVT
jgi:hypothetical protein